MKISLSSTTQFLSSRSDDIRRWRYRIFIALTCVYAVIALAGIGNFVVKTQPFHSFNGMIEQVLEFTAANNFAKRGFWANLFMADYASSPNSQDHPYLYTHMPAGPAVALGILIKAGLSLLQTRLIFSLITFVGFIALFLLICKITALPELALVALVVFSIDYDGQLRYVDHFVHAFSGLSYFGSLLLYLMYLDSPRRKWIVGFLICLTLGLLTSFISCIPILVAVTCAHFIFFKGNARSGHLLKWTFATCAFWAVVLLGRNCIVLGPTVALQDFVMTLGNRIFAWPSKDSMMAFFDEHKMVLWGVGKLETQTLKNWIVLAFLTPFVEFKTCLLILLVAFWGLRLDARDLGRKLGIIALIFACTYAWHLIFFAQGAIYAFPPIYRMFRIAMIVMLGVSIAELLSQVICLQRREPATFLKYSRIGYALFALALLSFSFSVVDDLHVKITEYKAARHNDFDARTLTSFDKLRAAPDGVIMTNIDALLLNFFLDNLTFGGCDQRAVEERDVSRCPSSFVARETKTQAKPRYFFSSSMYIPGYQTCQGVCQQNLVEKLRRTNPVVMEEPGAWILLKIND